MSKYYPQGIGNKIEKANISSEDLQFLIHHFPKNVILRVFGFAGTGKGTLSTTLANTLNIPNIESSLIWRAITYIYEDLKLDLYRENSDLVLGRLEVVHGDKNVLLVRYNGKVIERSALKSSMVDSKVAFYSADSYLRERFYDLMIEFLKSTDGSCVLDGRGAYPRYIQAAEQAGFQVVRLLLDASEKEMAQRYYAAYLAKKQKSDPGHIESEEEKEQMLQDFTQGIIARNQQDWDTWNKLNLGTITPDTAIFETTGMSIDEVTQTVLSYIKQTLEL
jgi:cytidylate kinase